MADDLVIDRELAGATAYARELLAGVEEHIETLLVEAARELEEAAAARHRAVHHAREILLVVGVAAEGLTRDAGPVLLRRLDPAPEGRTATDVPHLVPVLTLRQELVLRGLVFLGIAASLWFWVWWIARGHGAWEPGSIVATVLLAWASALPVYFYLFVARMTRPNPAVPVPDLRVAMVVTKAPSEPWRVVRATLEAMLSQQHPRPYDVWLADERPDDVTRAWCTAHGVRVSTREGVESYHRPIWPRRTRSKEGNLAYFYDHHGYKRYDVVAQFDADHVPAPGYLDAITRPFADPRVGYVCAPSVCDANEEAGWTVRGRLYREASVHGPVQAGSNQGFGPVCIGSHYAVRTAALRDVGGIGPELAEDYTTSLWMLSAGWDGVFSIDAEAHGDGPESLDEMLLQELQWSRSLGTVLVRWAPAKLRTVPRRAKLRMGFALAFYPAQGLALLAGTVLPVVAVLLGASWGHTSLAGFYAHMWPAALVGAATGVYLRRNRLLRPVGAKLWSWELLLFQLVRWPWTLWGFLQGMYAGVRSTGVPFKVTPKAATGPKPMRPQSIAPVLGVALVSALPVVLVEHPGEALGLQMLAGLQSLIYLAAATAAVLLHLLGNRRRQLAGSDAGAGWTAWMTGANGGRAALVTALVVGSTLVALTWRVVGPGLTP